MPDTFYEVTKNGKLLIRLKNNSHDIYLGMICTKYQLY